MEGSLPVRAVAVVSCHLERPLDDEAWTRFSRIQERRPSGIEIAALIRPPHESEDRELWLERARTAARRGPLGHHTHWTSPTHARPTGGDPSARVREEADWMRAQGLAPTLFCGGGWYMDEGVAEAVMELGYTDCTARGLAPCRVRLPSGVLLPELPTTHSVGALARGVVSRFGRYVHAYFHDYDLLDERRRLALLAGLTVLGRRTIPCNNLLQGDSPEIEFSRAFSR
jgi:hypothetical protein